MQGIVEILIITCMNISLLHLYYLYFLLWLFSGCPGGATPNRQCLLNPCSFSTCRAFPNAQCEVDACDSCISRYTVGLTEVTSMCGEQNVCECLYPFV